MLANNRFQPSERPRFQSWIQQRRQMPLIVANELNGVKARIGEQVGAAYFCEKEAPALFVSQKIDQATSIGAPKTVVGRPVVGFQLNSGRRPVALDSFRFGHDVPLVDSECTSKH